MQSVREPILKPVAIAALRPTQITVGMREVAERRKVWRAKKGAEAAEFIGRHMIRVESVFVTVTANLSKLDQNAFWVVLDNRGWMHPFDAKGRRRPYADIPKSIGGLIDDPFRSLAGELRRAGGFAKDTTPFSEFLWADFLRHRMTRSSVERRFERALKEAVRLSRLKDASYLPGWCGPSSGD
jgi:hypothetical protein